MPNKSVHITYTGGTIGMKRDEDGYRPEPGYLQSLMNDSGDFQNPELPRWSVHEHDPLLDSSDMAPQNWMSIAHDILARYDEHDGFVVLHGTDTMAYTASALSFILRGLDKPVIITGSQVPLCELHSDARHNLMTSLRIASDPSIQEVCLYFNGRLLRGNRAVKVNCGEFDAFDSPNFPDLGHAGIRVEVQRDLLRPREEKELQLQAVGSAKVGALRLFPGIPPEVVSNILKPPLQGLVLECYGMGNAPVNDSAFLEALREAAARDVVIVSVTQCLRGTVNLGDYANSSALAQAGVLSGHDLTAEAALAKLYYLFEQDLEPQRVRELMQTDIRGEMTVPESQSSD